MSISKVVFLLWFFLFSFSSVGQAQRVDILPPSINFGEVHLPPGDSFTLSASFSIVCDYGSQTFDAPPSCSVSSGNHWINIQSDSSQCGSSVSFSANIHSALESGSYEGYIYVYCEGVGSTTVPVFLRVSREIGNFLTLSPNNFSISFTQANLTPRTVRIRVSNANPENRNFTWIAVPQVDWLEVEPNEGYGPSTVTVTVKPRGLPSGSFSGTILFFSNLNRESAENGVPLIVNIQIFPTQELGIYPERLFWSVEYFPENSTLPPIEGTLTVFAGPEGFGVSSSAPWVSISETSFSESEGIVNVSIIPDLIPGLGYGHHTAYIRIIDRASGFFRLVPVTLEIRRPGDPITLSVQTVSYSQVYLSIEAPFGGNLNISIPLEYENPDSISKIYFLVEDVSNPTLLWAYYPWCGDVFCVCSCLPEDQQLFCLLNLSALLSANPPPFLNLYPIRNMYNGATYSWSHCLAYSNGPVSEIHFGPQILQRSGHFFLYTKINNFLTLNAFQTIEVKIFSPTGVWRITDIFEGQAYVHYENLVIKENQGQIEGYWYGVPLTFYLGDGETYLFGFVFSLNGFIFEHQVSRITGSALEGRWRYYYDTRVSEWYRFFGEKVSNILESRVSKCLKR